MSRIKLFLFFAVTVCFVLSLRSVDLAPVGPALKKIGAGFSLLLAITLAAYYCGAIAWKYCLDGAARTVSTFRLFLVRHAGETIGMINPTGTLGAEAAKLYFLRDSGIPAGVLISSLLSSRVLMIIAHLSLFFPVIAWLLIREPQLTARFFVYFSFWQLAQIIVTIVVFVMLVIWAAWRSVRRSSRGGAKRIVQTIGNVRAALKVMTTGNRKELAIAYCFFLLHWLIGSLEFYVILICLGVDVSPARALVLDLGVMFFKIAGTPIPGQIGVEEYGNKVLLTMIGVHDEAIWITASILRRLRQTTWILVGAALYFTWDRWKNGIIRPTDGDLVRQP